MALVQESDKITLNNHIRNIVALINDTYTPDADSDWLSETLERYHHPQRFKTKEEVNAETQHRRFDERT